MISSRMALLFLSLSLAASHEELSGGRDPWRSVTFNINKPLDDRRRVLAGLHVEERFQARDEQFTAGYVDRLSDDWSWSARFAYKSIEKRGTGGGGFRGLYASFLAQVAPALPWIGAHDAAARMRHIADDWTNLAQECKAAFVQEDRDRLLAAGQMLDRIADSECALLGELHAAAA